MPGLMKQCFAALAGSIGVFSYGMAYGWVSPVINELTDEQGEIQATKEQLSWIVANIEIGCLTTSLLASYLMDRFGRKWSMLSSAPILIVSWILTLTTRSVWVLYIKRVLDGMGLGLVTTIAPVYLAEIAEPRVRGSILLSITITWYGGILMQYCVGTYLSYKVSSWVNLSLPVLYLVLFSYLPETPYFLLMKGHKREATKSLSWFRDCHPNQVKEEIRYIEGYLKKDNESETPFKAIFKNKIYLKCFIIMVVIILATIMTGLTTVFSYATEIFAHTSSGGFLNEDTCSLIIAAIFFLVTIPIALVIDHIGRRPLVILSGIGCFLSHCFSAIYWYYKDYINCNWIPFATVGSYAFFVTIGLSPVMVAYQGELFPSSIKGLASGVITLTITIASLITLKLYYIIGVSFGMYLNYILYATIVGVSTIWLYFNVPETKNKTFCELYCEFEKMYGREDRTINEELDILSHKPQELVSM